VITGNDFSLLKLNTILMKLQKGFTLQEASDGLEVLGSDAQYPRNAILETNTIPVDIPTVTRPESIATFLSSDIAESTALEPETLPVMDLSIFDNQFPPTSVSEPVTPTWQDMASEKRDRLPAAGANSLIERGINNVGDRRERQESHPMSMFDKMDFDLPTSVQTPQQAVQSGPPSSGLLGHVNSQLETEAGPAQMPELLPSFWSRDGYHSPNEIAQEETASELSGFNSPDTLLGNIDFDGNEVESLVASARRASNENRKLPSSEPTLTSHNSRLRKKSTANNSRLVKRRTGTNRNTQRRGRLVPSIGNAVRDLGSSLTNRLINSFEEVSNQPTNLRERADEAQQDELETFRNLAESNGGLIPDEKARQLEANVRRRNSLIEQNEQEFADSENPLSWTELVDSEEHKNSSSGKGGLPRIDL